MTRVLKIVILAWLAVFLQSSISPLFSIWGLVPDLIAVIISAAALGITANAGMLTGLWSGFLADCYRPSTMGLFTVSGVICGYLSGALRERVYREQPATQALVAGLLCLIRQTFDFWGHGGGSLAGYFRFLFRYGLGSAVYTILIYLLLSSVLNKLLSDRGKVRSRTY